MCDGFHGVALRLLYGNGLGRMECSPSWMLHHLPEVSCKQKLYPAQADWSDTHHCKGHPRIADDATLCLQWYQRIAVAHLHSAYCVVRPCAQGEKESGHYDTAIEYDARADISMEHGSRSIAPRTPSRALRSTSVCGNVSRHTNVHMRSVKARMTGNECWT